MLRKQYANRIQADGSASGHRLLERAEEITIGVNSVPGRQLHFPRDTTIALWTRRSLPIGRRDSDLRYLHTHM